MLLPPLIMFAQESAPCLPTTTEGIPGEIPLLASLLGVQTWGLNLEVGLRVLGLLFKPRFKPMLLQLSASRAVWLGA